MMYVCIVAIHNDTGKTGEQLAAELLRSKGYEVLALNWRHGRSEVDIIARIGNDLVFAEVKTRSTGYFGFPEESVSKRKQELLQEAADAYLERHDLSETDVRFDIIAVITAGNEPAFYHMEDAFWPGE